MTGVSSATVLAGASLAAAVGGTAMSAMGAAQQGAAAQNAANYQAQVAKNAQQVAQWSADDALRRGQVAEDARRSQTAQQIGTQRAAMASMGGDINSGSAVDIVGDTAAAGEFDALTLRNNAQREAYGFKVKASNAGADAGLAVARGDAAEQAGMFGAGANLLAGASTVADKWSHWKTNLDTPANLLASGRAPV
jgi:hypothetical protein